MQSKVAALAEVPNQSQQGKTTPPRLMYPPPDLSQSPEVLVSVLTEVTGFPATLVQYLK